MKIEKGDVSETDVIVEEWMNGQVMSEARFVILYGERISFVTRSPGFAARLSDKGTVNVDALGWLETVA